MLFSIAKLRQLCRFSKNFRFSVCLGEITPICGWVKSHEVTATGRSEIPPVGAQKAVFVTFQ